MGTDRAQLSSMAKQTKAALETDTLDVVADRGYFNSAEILACDEAGITVTLPKPLTSNNNLLIRDTPPVGMYVLNMFCMRGSRLWGSRLHRACVV